MTHSCRFANVPTIGKNMRMQTDATSLDAWASDDEDGPDVVNGMRRTEASYLTKRQAQAMQVL